MCTANSAKSLCCELVNNTPINGEIFRLDFFWPGPAPVAGQFFMIKPKRSSVFLGRPLSAAGWHSASGSVKFLVARRGRGTEELADMRIGEEAELIGPLGNAWADFLPKGEKPAALVGGGIGIAPLEALAVETQKNDFHFYAGFRTGFKDDTKKNAMLDSVSTNVRKLVIATEDGSTGHKGMIVDFFDAEEYRAVLACGPQPMLKVVKAKCEAANVPCFLSLERRMACGVGACLGCTVSTISGNRRCCADGPIFNAREICFDE